MCGGGGLLTGVVVVVVVTVGGHSDGRLFLPETREQRNSLIQVFAFRMNEDLYVMLFLVHHLTTLFNLSRSLSLSTHAHTPCHAIYVPSNTLVFSTKKKNLFSQNTTHPLILPFLSLPLPSIPNFHPAFPLLTHSSFLSSRLHTLALNTSLIHSRNSPPSPHLSHLTGFSTPFFSSSNSLSLPHSLSPSLLILPCHSFT